MKTACAAAVVMIGALHLGFGQEPIRIPGLPLRDRTPVEVQPLHLIASWRSQPSDAVRLRVVGNVTADGLVVIEAGTLVTGIIVEADLGRIGRRPARLAFAVEETTSVAGETIRLRPTSIEVTGRYRHPYLLWAGQESTFTVFVDGAHWVTGQERREQPGPKSARISVPWPRDRLTNDDVLKLVEAGMSEEVILAKIETSEPAFDLDAEALIALKQAGVSNVVLVAMIEARAER